MGAALDSLLGLVDADTCFDIPAEELLPRQIAAADELFQERRPQVGLLANRAEEGQVRTIRAPEDIVPLLFAHTSYKSYPEAWFTQGRWDRMGQWVNTLTTQRVPTFDTQGLTDVDDWIDRMAEHGHFLSCSSGTTGKCSIIPSDRQDLDFAPRQSIRSMTWSTGIPATPAFKGFALAPANRNFRMLGGLAAFSSAFTTDYRPFPLAPIKVGDVTRMVALRRRIAEGVARPGEIAAFEELSQQRARELEDAFQSTAEAIVAARAEPLFLRGFLGPAWEVTKRVRAMGYSAKDFHPDNVFRNAGGTKGADLPPDVRDQISRTYNIRPERFFQLYSMQEINSAMPKCRAGRYHLPPWMMLLVLNRTGEALEPIADGEVEGRAAFFDMSLHGRWAGLISGDKVSARYGRCECGHAGPTVGDRIERYSDLAGGDKISCAGTIDAYVRGAV